MNKEEIIEIAKDAQNKSNKDLSLTLIILKDEFEKTKDLIVNLTRHLDAVEDLYNNVNNEIKKRTNANY